MTAKTSVDSVRLEMIADMEIPTPTIEEQIKIGTYFDHLDHLITLHQCKFLWGSFRIMQYLGNSVS